jgi:PAS domain S-box-containing protein
MGAWLRAGVEDSVDPVQRRSNSVHRDLSQPLMSTPCVLVVDDLPANLVALESVIGELRYPVVLANSGSDALKRMLETEFACVLLDLRMPGIDGLETAALIRKRERHRDLPILFITSGQPSLDEMSQAYSLGAVDFIQRPLDSEILKSKIRVVAKLYAERDVARREKEAELRKGQERLALVFDQVPLALWSTDEKLRLTFCGGAMYGRGGVPRPEDLVGQSLHELLPAADGREHPTVVAHRSALLGGCQTYTEERSGRTYEGTLRPLRDARGDITGVLGVAVEVTERRQAHRVLQDCQEHFDSLMKGVKDYALIFLDPEGRVERWNIGAETISGYAAAEAVGMSYRRFFTPEDQASGKPDRLLSEAGQAGSIQDQGWRVRKDGTRFWADVLLTALRSPDRTLRGYVKITRDLTERRKAEEDMGQLKRDLEGLVEARTAALQGSVEELKAFNHTLAHDIRSPLRALIGMSQVLLEEYEGKALDRDGQVYLKGIVESARRMDQMTQDLLTYARLSQEEVVLEPLDVGPILGKTLAEMAADLAERNAAVTPEALCGTVRAHPLLVKQILTNLLYNAIKFVRPGVDPVVRVRSEARGAAVRIWVEDNGIGVATGDQSRIFRIFERLHPPKAYPGTGVGLAIVKRAVERMGGQVGLESEPGCGSRFWFELPRA